MDRKVADSSHIPSPNPRLSKLENNSDPLLLTKLNSEPRLHLDFTGADF